LPAEVATPDGGTRPVTEDDYLALLGLLNSSTIGFWMKQVCHCKGGGGIGGGIAAESWERFYAFNGTKLNECPLPSGRPLELAQRLDRLATELQSLAPQEILTQTREGAKQDDNTDFGASAPLRET